MICASGLVVKSNVAIVGPRVRFPAGAVYILLISLLLISPPPYPPEGGIWRMHNHPMLSRKPLPEQLGWIYFSYLLMATALGFDLICLYEFPEIGDVQPILYLRSSTYSLIWSRVYTTSPTSFMTILYFDNLYLWHKEWIFDSINYLLTLFPYDNGTDVFTSNKKG